jgi:signal transduction histidine kinase
MPSASDRLGQEVWRDDGTGRRQPLLANADPVLDASGVAVEVVHSMRDISRLKQAEEAKTMFLATASHELKTPLTVIRGFAETLLRQKQSGGEIAEDALQAIHRRAIELTKIVDRLLLSSRIEAGRIRLDLRAVDVAPILAERTAAFGAATARPVACLVEPDLPAVLGEEDAIVTVLDHLLDNAAKYSSADVPILVRTGTADARVWFEVEDSGIGMDNEAASRCFDKFWQAESNDVRRYGGTGIGLYIVRSLVEGIGGSVSVRSVPGRGSTFRVELVEAVFVPTLPPAAGDEGEATSIREFMRQIGVPTAQTAGKAS